MLTRTPSGVWVRCRGLLRTGFFPHSRKAVSTTAMASLYGIMPFSSSGCTNRTIEFTSLYCLSHVTDLGRACKLRSPTRRGTDSFLGQSRLPGAGRTLLVRFLPLPFDLLANGRPGGRQRFTPDK